MNKKRFNIVLHAPDIPGNTGSIGRTCVALDLRLILIKPYGFDLSEKAVRRAGLDYWKHIELSEYENWDDFESTENPENLIFYSKTGAKNYYEAPYQENCFLVFGSETKALPSELMEKYKDKLYSLPQYSEHIRSLNLSNVATAAAYEALRQISFS
jgi:tRNA (cytidine/uridine-2'-O-)-methyltransferase